MTVWGWTPPPVSAHSALCYTSTRMPALSRPAHSPPVSAPHTHSRVEGRLCTGACTRTPRRARAYAHTEQLKDSPVWTNAHLHMPRCHHSHSPGTQDIREETHIPVADTRALHMALGLGSPGRAGCGRLPGHPEQVQRRIREAKTFWSLETVKGETPSPHPAARITFSGQNPGGPTGRAPAYGPFGKGASDGRNVPTKAPG